MVAIRDFFEPHLAFSIHESDGDVDGKVILAKVSGEMFFPDGVSRNKRFYPRQVWENVLQDANVLQRLAERRTYGTIGHNQKIDEAAFLEGKVSHIVTGLRIENGKGIGEILILDTPAGRMLNTLFRAKCKMFVSSRATGDYKGEMSGIPAVDPDSFVFETIDFVIEPGFLDASPALTESLSKIFEELTKLNQGEKLMTAPNAAISENTNAQAVNHLIEALSKENRTIKSDFDTASRELTGLKDNNTVIAEENRHLKAEMARLRAKAALVERFSRFGTPDELDKLLKLAEDYAEFFGANGSPKEIRESLLQSRAALKLYAKIGTPAEIQEAMKVAMNTVGAYAAHGTVREVAEVISLSEKLIRTEGSRKAVKRITELAKELKVPEAAIRKLAVKMSETEIRDFYKAQGENSRSPSQVFAKSGNTSKLNESATQHPRSVTVMSLTEKLMESMSA